ncbi:MAG: type IV pilus twitching motility protein PilT, partial [Opitutales bacterium]
MSITPAAFSGYRVNDAPYQLSDLLEMARPKSDEAFLRISDFHLAEGAVIRVRIDGELQEIEDGEPLSAEAFRGLLSPVLPASAKEELNQAKPISADFAFSIGSRRFRCNVFSTIAGHAAAIRVLPTHIPAPDTIGLPDPRLGQAITQLRHGLILMTGATGSGKSTSTASLVQEILNTQLKRVITLEDPAEFLYENGIGLVSQRELGTHISSFGNGLRSALREDPDVIVVEEVRDQTTTQLALTAAETGHIVFATLHTRDAIGALPRLIDLGPPEAKSRMASQLALSLRYVLGNQLLPGADGGRVLCMEVLQNNNAVANHIRSQRWEQLTTAMQTSQKDGMWT